MSIARKILMIIAFILSIFMFIGLGICAIALFVSSGNEEQLKKILDGLNRSTMSLEDGKTFVTFLGVLFSIITLLALINAVLAIKGVKSHKIVLMVLNIVFGVISGIYINSLGGIFGLIEKD